MNKKVLTAALAAVIAGSSFGIASAADAQSYGRGPAHAQPPHAQPARPAPPAVRPAPAPQSYGRWQQAQRRYSAPRYVAPRGYQARAWSYGQRLPSQYRTRSYVVTDYGRYGLRRPPSGYQYVRSGNDVVLAAVTTGLITAVIAGLFN
ncbi:MAG: hypothetical protein EBR82_03370 [Caulobacteraceae bacterium]|nr:hypothetical protein [Caulobacteraceae bacterium]